MSLKFALPLVAALAVPLGALAQPAEPVSGLVRLTATAKELVANDYLVASVYYQHESEDPKALMEHLNRKTQEARDIAARFEGLSVSTTSFHTQPIYAEQRITGWRARVDLSVAGAIDGSITKALAALQEVFVVGSLTPQVSPALRDAARKKLSLAAVSQFRSDAGAYAAAFGAPSWTLHEASIDSQHVMPAPMPRMYRATAQVAAEMAAPMPVEAGETTLEVSVSGAIQLAPAQTQD